VRDGFESGACRVDPVREFAFRQRADLRTLQRQRPRLRTLHPVDEIVPAVRRVSRRSPPGVEFGHRVVNGTPRAPGHIATLADPVSQMVTSPERLDVVSTEESSWSSSSERYAAAPRRHLHSRRSSELSVPGAEFFFVASLVLALQLIEQ